MPRARKVCSVGGCPDLAEQGKSRCDDHIRQADERRGTATERGYTGRPHRIFRRAVLRKHPACVCPDPDHGHDVPCAEPSTAADHHPLSRRQLEDLGLNPNDPNRGRGLCKPCHDKHTASAQPGGWNAYSGGATG
jgi:5-methylcytosine-specific restriction protein A